MLASLECRAPFLDHRIMDFSYSIPDKFLINGNNRKKILKDTFANLLPNNFFKSPKAGFEIPIGEWFRNELKEDMKSTLSEKNLSIHSYFNQEFVNKIIEDHLSTKVDNSWKIWTLYCFQKWYNQNFI
jgi:asparagine synthase (glutamine-hydrolysing)